MGFADGLDMEYERKTGVKSHPKVFNLVNRKDGVIIT